MLMHREVVFRIVGQKGDNQEFKFSELGSSVGKESACDAGDTGSIPGSGSPLEKGMATHSSILAWRISGTEEPGGLQSIGLQRVGLD